MILSFSPLMRTIVAEHALCIPELSQSRAKLIAAHGASVALRERPVVGALPPLSAATGFIFCSKPETIPYAKAPKSRKLMLEKLARAVESKRLLKTTRNVYIAAFEYATKLILEPKRVCVPSEHVFYNAEICTALDF